MLLIDVTELSTEIIGGELNVIHVMQCIVENTSVTVAPRNAFMTINWIRASLCLSLFCQTEE